MGASGAVSLSNSQRGRGDPRAAPACGRARVERLGDDRQPRLVRRPGSRSRSPSEGETAGTGGARLWDTLRISISDGSSVVYEGRVADLGRLTLGALAAGGQRTYTVTAWLPSGADDNALQGARLSLRFTWLAESTATATDPTPGPDPAARQPAGRAGHAGDADHRPPTRARRSRPRQLISLPAAKKCVSQAARRVKFTPPARREDQVRRDHRQRPARARRRRAPRPRSRSAACPSRARSRSRSRATLSTGRKLTLKRTYKACGNKGPGPLGCGGAVERVRRGAGELGDDLRRARGAGAGLDQLADGLDRRRVEAGALRGAADDEHDLAARRLGRVAGRRARRRCRGRSPRAAWSARGRRRPGAPGRARRARPATRRRGAGTRTRRRVSGDGEHGLERPRACAGGSRRSARRRTAARWPPAR